MKLESADNRRYGKLLIAGAVLLLAGCNSVFVLTGNPAHPGSTLAITQTTLAAGTVGSAYSSAVGATGGTAPYTYSANNLPSGLSMNNATGAVTGTPAASAVGTRTVTVVVTDATQPSAQSTTAALSITIGAAVVAPSALTITTLSLPGGTVGTAYSGAIAATGGTAPYTFNASNLPSGLGINHATGAITGTPAQSALGTTSVALTVADAGQPAPQTATANLNISIATAVVAPPSTLTITTTSLPDGTAGSTYTGGIAATGGTSPYRFSASNLPSGLSINGSTGAITGTPAQSSVGTASVVFTVTDATQPTAQSVTTDLNIIVDPAIVGATCGNMSTGNGASLNGFVPFPSSDLWNANIASAPVDPNSATIISGLSASNLHPDFGTLIDGYGIPYVVIDSSVTPGVDITMTTYPSESDIMPYPIPITAPIEGFPADCTSNGDNHLLVLDRSKCWLYETWETQRCNGVWTAANGAIWDLTKSERRPYGWTSADAAGLPIFPGLVRYDEVAAGAINHAIRMTVAHTRNDANGGLFVAPATHAAGNNSSTPNVMGMRLRLKASFNISGFSANNQVILKAMQQYGLIVADNGSNMYFEGATDARWDDNDLDALKTINASQFDVIQMGTEYDDATAPTGPAPTVSSFTASQSNVAVGTTVTLNWTVTGDSYDFIDVAGPVRGGTQTVTPTVTTTYTLNSTNQFGRSTQQVTVTVH